MEILLLACVAAAASLLTFFSGFGLGTVLLPVFLLFYPVELAIGMTAIVHFLNGIFKTGLVGRHAARQIVLHFGIPAIVFAFLGASLLVYLASFPIHIQYKLGGIPLSTSPVKVVIGLLLLIFAMIEILPGSRRMRASRLWLWSGGVLSGFFGGLSGHQGALRSSFLIQIGLSKEQFIATGILNSLLIDITRLPVYLTSLNPAELRAEWIPVVATTLAAFTGALIGRKLLTKVTLRFVQSLVAIAVAIIGILLSVGVV
jgi:uncharacterized membrane protein YfcA